MTSPQQPPRTRGWVLGRFAGAPVVLRPVWFLVAALATGFLVPLVRVVLPRAGTGLTVGVAAAFVVVLFASVLLHELAHAWTARRLGRQVHEVVLSALGGHTTFTRGDLGPGGSALVAVSGPLVNLVLGGALLALAQPLLSAPVEARQALGVLVAAMASANLLVGGFNLVPGLPLDGGQLLVALVWRLTGRQSSGVVAAAWVGRALALGIVAWSLLRPLLLGARPDTVTVVWTLLVASAVWSGASVALRQARTQDAAARLTVAAVGRAARGVPQDGLVAELPADPRETVLVDASGAPVGLVDRAALEGVPSHLAAQTPLWAVARPVRPGAVVDAALTGPELLHALVLAFRVQPVVVALEDGRVVAVLHDQEVARSLR